MFGRHPRLHHYTENKSFALGIENIFAVISTPAQRDQRGWGFRLVIFRSRTTGKPGTVSSIRHQRTNERLFAIISRTNTQKGSNVRFAE